MINENHYELAIDVAKSSPSRKQVGAILLRKGKVVTTATNLERKSHPLQAKFAEKVGLGEKIFLHAEISALVKCREECDTIVVARVGGHSKNELRNAKPCKICAMALEEAGIDKVHYSTDDGFLYRR